MTNAWPDLRIAFGRAFADTLDADAHSCLFSLAAIQQCPSSTKLRIELLPGATTNLEQLTARLRHKLQERGFPESVRMQVQLVPSVAPDPRTGKLRRMLSDLTNR
ncbi:MAG: hypothetical protein NTY19_51850 [Planctomycetota bacterium]|nr:hypothetical protein [Planctomycetota bacterium]